MNEQSGEGFEYKKVLSGWQGVEVEMQDWVNAELFLGGAGYSCISGSLNPFLHIGHKSHKRFISGGECALAPIAGSL